MKQPPAPAETATWSDPSAWLAGTWEVIRDIWNYQLFTVEGQPLDLGRIIVATGLLIVGMALSRRLSRGITRRILGRFHLSTSAMAVFQTLIFYALLVLFTLTALRLASVPLGVFAVLGGALAIGVGFGSQNVVNNFISGIILMIEQDVKVGDLIKVGETMGLVERIGARSTVVRTSENIQMVVPNSQLLEKEVANWTLADNDIRATVAVGVAYGSDVQKTRELLLQAAREHDAVLPTPPPEVFFSDFGDNSLLFHLVFWLQIRTFVERRRAESALRFEIDRLFKEASIVIAFPQRDVHLDSARPIEVRVIGPGG